MVLLKNDGVLPFEFLENKNRRTGPVGEQTAVLLGNDNGTPTRLFLCWKVCVRNFREQTFIMCRGHRS